MTRGGKAVVYFGEPFNSDFVLIPLRHLRKTDVTPLELERFKRKHPDVAKYVGVKQGVELALSSCNRELTV